jgi:hypothetical protein
MDRYLHFALMDKEYFALENKASHSQFNKIITRKQKNK